LHPVTTTASKTREWRHPIDELVLSVRPLLGRRIVRYALVGGIGIPINVLAYALFRLLLGVRLDPLDSALAFEVSTTINFVLNQLFTYSDQKHLRGWDWPRRALTAQAASLSALALSWAIAQGIKYVLEGQGHHEGYIPYLAQAMGIVAVFVYNFSIANRFVFRPASPTRVTPPPPA